MPSDDAPTTDAAPADKDRVYLINRVVGKRYEVLEFLGEGPLLASFRTRDQQLNRIVTLKILRSEYAQRSDIIESLRAGWAETLSLTHSGIARSYDVGEDVALTLLYHVEEFVRGIDLKERIKRVAPLQLTAAVDIALALAEALEYSHPRGIAHGDLCPQNILIGPEGQVKVSGFGTSSTYALLTKEDPRVLMRMAHYAAPDLATHSLATTSADLYALSAILYEMLTGETPFKGDNAVQLALRHAQEQPHSPRAVNLAVPRALEGVILKGLAKRPQDRYTSATDLLVDLRKIREALRFGRSLAWSPLDGEGSLDTVAPVVAVIPSIVENPTDTGRRVSKAVSTDVLPKKNTKEKSDRSMEEIDHEEAPAPRRIGGVLLAVNLFLLLALIGAGALVFNWIKPFLSPANQVVVPELRGKTLTEAKAIANESHFKLAVQDQVYMDDKPANTIYQQKERPGDKILEGKEVTIWVSKGPEMVLIPNVEEVTLDKAQKDLEKVGLKVGTISRRFDPITPTGVVLEQLPRGDGSERRARGTKIDLTLSKGPEPEPTPEPTPPPTPEPTMPTAPDPGTNPAGLPDPEDTRQRTFRVPYRTPQDGQQHHIVIQVEDSEGTHTGYDNMHGPGQTVATEISGVGRPIIIKLYDNDDLKAQTLAVKGR